MNNTILKNTLSAAAVVLILSACSQKAEDKGAPETADQAKPFTETVLFESTELLSETFTVEAFDMDTKTVKLINKDGEKTTVVASDEALNLDQVKPGAKVIASFLKNISVEVIDDQELQPDVVVIDGVARAAKGETAAVEAVEAAIVIFKIEDINLEDNTYKLKSPDGTVNQYTALNPENLTKGSVGDAVVLTITEAVSISLVKDDAEEKDD